MLTAFVLAAALTVPAVAEIPQMPDGSICYSMMFGPEVVGNGRIYGLAPGAPEEIKARILYLHQRNELRRLSLGHGPRSVAALAITTDAVRNKRYCRNCSGGGGGITYNGLWQPYYGCDICRGTNCTATCWNNPGFPPCPPGC